MMSDPDHARAEADADLQSAKIDAAAADRRPRRTALVAGASGLVGGHCARLVCASEQYDSVVTVGRRSLGWTHAKLREVETDFERLDAVRGRLRSDDVFCCLGTTMRKAGSRAAFRTVDFEYPLRLARVCRELGAQRFLLVSSIGADPASRTFYLRVKGELERALAGLDFPTLLLVRPSVLLGPREERRFSERAGQLILRTLTPVLVGRLRRLRPVRARDVATALVALAAGGEVGTRVIESDHIAALARSSAR